MKDPLLGPVPVEGRGWEGSWFGPRHRWSHGAVSGEALADPVGHSEDGMAI